MDSPASGAIIARLSAIGRWRAARQENRARPAVGRSCGADRQLPSAHPRPPAPCCRAQTARPSAFPWAFTTNCSGVTLAEAHANLFAPMVAAGALDPALDLFLAKRFDVPAAA